MAPSFTCEVLQQFVRASINSIDLHFLRNLLPTTQNRAATMGLLHLVAHWPLVLSLATNAIATTETRDNFAERRSCRLLPGDREWPNADAWDRLNASVSGRLIATKSPGYVCHDPTYDAEACAALQQSWTLPQAQYVHFQLRIQRKEFMRLISGQIRNTRRIHRSVSAKQQLHSIHAA